MEINAVYENLPALNSKDLSDKIKVENKTEISTENIAKIINLNSTSYITEVKVEQGKIKYFGRATFFLCYVDGEKIIKKYESGIEFKGEIISDCITENSKVKIVSKPTKNEADVSGVFLSLTSYLDIKAKVFIERGVKALTSGENLIIKPEEKAVVKSYGVRTGSYTISEEKDLNYKIEEVLAHTAHAKISAVQCGVGSIIIDGDIFVSSVFLQSGDKKGIIKENFSFPFRAEVEYEECMPSLKAKAEVLVKSFKTDISVDEEKNLSRETVSVQLSLSGEAFSIDSISLASDVFDLKNELKIEREKVSIVEPSEIKVIDKEFSGRVQIDSVDNAEFILTMGEDVEIVDKVEKEGVVLITGIFSANALFGVDGEIVARRVELPFEEEIKAENVEICAVSVAVKNSNLTVSANEFEVKFESAISCSTEIRREVEVITNITGVCEKKENDSAISVYIPYNNEDMWSLSKRLNVSPESLSESNPELQFPLTGEERILVYRQK